MNLKITTKTNKSLSVIIAAGGDALRLGQSIPKQFVLLGGKPFLIHCVEKFLMLENIIEIIILTSNISETNLLLNEYDYLEGSKPVKIKAVIGGKLRKDSVYNGFFSLTQKVDLVLVHDVARPLVKLKDTVNCIEVASKTNAAILASPVVDTFKRGKLNNNELLVETTIDRENLYSIQTPQVISYDLLKEVYEKDSCKEGVKLNFTDEAMLLEHYGKPVNLVIGSNTNIKITYPDDLKIAEAIFNNEKKELNLERNLLTANS